MNGIDYKTMFEKSGIYQITNILNNKTYIGSSKNIYNRLHQHFCKLQYKNSHNKHLQYSFQKYGKENFKVEVLMYCCEKERLKLEQLFLEKYKPEYNKSLNVKGSLNTFVSNERKKQISNTLKSKYKSGEIKAYKQKHNWKTIYVYDIFTLNLIRTFDNKKQIYYEWNLKIGSYNKIEKALRKNKNNKYQYFFSLKKLDKKQLIDKIKQCLPTRNFKELSNLPF